MLDEADRMLDMGFIQPIRRICRMLPAVRQNLMFSATYSEDIRQLAEKMLRNPLAIEVASRNKTADRVEQIAFRATKDQKRHLLVHLFENGVGTEGPWQQALVFARTKHGANRLAEQLDGAGVRAAAIHGNKSQAARVRALEDFKAGKIRALVATEVASRGLDIKELPQVVNYELPNVPEDYVHRIGRTARAGSTGHAVSLVAPDEGSLLRDIERTMRQQVPFAPTPEFKIIEMRAIPDRPPLAQGHGNGQGSRHGGGGGRQGGGGGQRHGGSGGQRHGGGGGQGQRSGQGGRGGQGGGPGGGHGSRGVAGSSLSRPSASPNSPGGSAPRPGGHGGRPGSRSNHFEPSRRNRSAS